MSSSSSETSSHDSSSSTVFDDDRVRAKTAFTAASRIYEFKDWQLTALMESKKPAEAQDLALTYRLDPHVPLLYRANAMLAIGCYPCDRIPDAEKFLIEAWDLVQEFRLRFDPAGQEDRTDYRYCEYLERQTIEALEVYRDAGPAFLRSIFERGAPQKVFPALPTDDMPLEDRCKGLAGEGNRLSVEDVYAHWITLDNDDRRSSTPLLSVDREDLPNPDIWQGIREASSAFSSSSSSSG